MRRFEKAPRLRWTRLLVLGAVLLPASAHADTPPTAPPAEQASPPPRALPVAAAIVPGVVVHGTGHFVRGDARTGRALLVGQGVGLGLVGTGLFGLWLTGASRRVVAPLAVASLSGIWLLAGTFLLDVYGVAMPDAARGSAPAKLPFVQTEGGIALRYDRQYPGRALVTQAVELRLGALSLREQSQTVPGDPSSRTRGRVGYRVVRGEGSRDGSFLELALAGTHQRWARESVSSTGVEAVAVGRLDLQHVGRSLRGAFAELSVGTALVAVRYAGVATDTDSLLLVRGAYGVYLGEGRGEVNVYYDHRRDTYAGGLLIPGIGAGYGGHLGLDAHYFVTPAWGLRAEVAAGSALVAGLGVIFRAGARP